MREIWGTADETHRNEVLLSQKEDDDEVSEGETKIDAKILCRVGNLQSASHDAVDSRKCVDVHRVDLPQ